MRTLKLLLLHLLVLDFGVRPSEASQLHDNPAEAHLFLLRSLIVTPWSQVVDNAGRGQEEDIERPKPSEKPSLSDSDRGLSLRELLFVPDFEPKKLSPYDENSGDDRGLIPLQDLNSSAVVLTDLFQSSSFPHSIPGYKPLLNPTCDSLKGPFCAHLGTSPASTLWQQLGLSINTVQLKRIRDLLSSVNIERLMVRGLKKNKNGTKGYEFERSTIPFGLWNRAMSSSEDSAAVLSLILLSLENDILYRQPSREGPNSVNIRRLPRFRAENFVGDFKGVQTTRASTGRDVKVTGQNRIVDRAPSDAENHYFHFGSMNPQYQQHIESEDSNSYFPPLNSPILLEHSLGDMSLNKDLFDVLNEGVGWAHGSKIRTDVIPMNSVRSQGTLSGQFSESHYLSSLPPSPLAAVAAERRETLQKKDLVSLSNTEQALYSVLADPHILMGYFDKDKWNIYGEALKLDPKRVGDWARAYTNKSSIQSPVDPQTSLVSLLSKAFKTHGSKTIIPASGANRAATPQIVEMMARGWRHRVVQGVQGLHPLNIAKFLIRAQGRAISFILRSMIGLADWLAGPAELQWSNLLNIMTTSGRPSWSAEKGSAVMTSHNASVDRMIAKFTNNRNRVESGIAYSRFAGVCKKWVFDNHLPLSMHKVRGGFSLGLAHDLVANWVGAWTVIPHIDDHVISGSPYSDTDKVHKSLTRCLTLTSMAGGIVLDPPVVVQGLQIRREGQHALRNLDGSITTHSLWIRGYSLGGSSIDQDILEIDVDKILHGKKPVYLEEEFYEQTVISDEPATPKLLTVEFPASLSRVSFIHVFWSSLPSDHLPKYSTQDYSLFTDKIGYGTPPLSLCSLSLLLPKRLFAYDYNQVMKLTPEPRDSLAIQRSIDTMKKLSNFPTKVNDLPAALLGAAALHPIRKRSPDTNPMVAGIPTAPGVTGLGKAPLNGFDLFQTVAQGSDMSWPSEALSDNGEVIHADLRRTLNVGLVQSSYIPPEAATVSLYGMEKLRLMFRFRTDETSRLQYTEAEVKLVDEKAETLANDILGRIKRQLKQVLLTDEGLKHLSDDLVASVDNKNVVNRIRSFVHNAQATQGEDAGIDELGRFDVVAVLRDQDGTLITQTIRLEMDDEIISAMNDKTPETSTSTASPTEIGAADASEDSDNESEGEAASRVPDEAHTQGLIDQGSKDSDRLDDSSLSNSSDQVATSPTKSQTISMDEIQHGNIVQRVEQGTNSAAAGQISGSNAKEMSDIYKAEKIESVLPSEHPPSSSQPQSNVDSSSDILSSVLYGLDNSGMGEDGLESPWQTSMTSAELLELIEQNIQALQEEELLRDAESLGLNFDGTESLLELLQDQLDDLLSKLDINQEDVEKLNGQLERKAQELNQAAGHLGDVSTQPSNANSQTSSNLTLAEWLEEWDMYNDNHLGARQRQQAAYA